MQSRPILGAAARGEPGVWTSGGIQHLELSSTPRLFGPASAERVSL